MDVYAKETVWSGRAQARIERQQKLHVDPIKRILENEKIRFQEFSRYLMARHAQERNAVVKQRDPQNNSGSGLTDQQAQAILASVQRSGKEASYEAAAQHVYDMLAYARAALRDNGLISDATYNQWSQRYKYYVPLRGAEVNTGDDPDNMRTGHGFDIRGPESRAALGRYTVADNPLAYTLMQMAEAVIRSEKNRVAKTMYRLVSNYPNPGLWRVFHGETRRRLNPSTGLVETYTVPPQVIRRDNIFAAKFGGKTVYMEFNDQRIAEALRNATIGMHSSLLGRVFHRIMRFYAGLLTSFNPEFMTTNYWKDIETALFNVSELKNKPKSLRLRIVGEALSLKSIRGILAELHSAPGRTIFGAPRAPNQTLFGTQRTATAMKYARYFEEYRLSGGQISFLGYEDIENVKSRLMHSFSQNKVMEGLRTALHLVENMNTAVENGVRLSVFKALRDNGVPRDRAAFVAKELTINFNRKGRYGPLLNGIYLFFNASIQSPVRVLQVATRSNVARGVLAGLVLLGMFNDVANYLLAGDDDDDGENAWDKLLKGNEWLTDRNLVLMTPGLGAPDAHVMIPISYELTPFVKMGMMISRSLRGNTSAAEAGIKTFTSFADSFNPFGTPSTFLQYVTPTLIKPFVEMAENKDWAGRPIYPFKAERNQPWAETYFSSAPHWAIELSRILNETSGGNRFRSGWADISPESFDHMANFAGGGLGKVALNTIATGERLIFDEDLEPHKLPFIRRFYGAGTKGTKIREFESLWYTEIDPAYYEYKKFEKAGEKEQTLAAAKRNKLQIAVYPDLKKIQKEIRTLKKDRDALILNREMPDAEKKQKLDLIQGRQVALAKTGLKVYQTAKQRLEGAPEN
jgi:hypothetical protein